MSHVSLTRQGVRDCDGPEFAGLFGFYPEDVPDNRPGRPRATVTQRNRAYRSARRRGRVITKRELLSLAFLRGQTGLIEVRPDPQERQEHPVWDFWKLRG